METKRLDFTLYGNVQGILLRDFVKNKAKELDLVGYIENKSNGTVHIIAEGEVKMLDILIDRIRSRTSNDQKIEDSIISFGTASGEFDEFKKK